MATGKTFNGFTFKSAAEALAAQPATIRQASDLADALREFAAFLSAVGYMDYGTAQAHGDKIAALRTRAAEIDARVAERVGNLPAAAQMVAMWSDAALARRGFDVAKIKRMAAAELAA